LTTDAQASADRIPELLRLRPDAVLVGAQALVVWANVLGVRTRPPLEPYVTSDIDFLGSREVARELARKLGAQLLVPPKDDHVQVNAAVLLLRGKDGGRVLVDFLSVVSGLDVAKIRARALEVEAFDTVFKVMHPVDCLASRIGNLHLIPAKRNETGAAQARLAVEIVHEYIAKVAGAGEARHALDLVEHVGKLARTAVAAQVGEQFHVRILDAIPLTALPRAFQEKQWPRLVARAERKAKPYRATR
jgi:hypothetical protein